MENLSAGYGDKLILQKIKLNLVPGSRIGLLGREMVPVNRHLSNCWPVNSPLSGKLEPSKGVKIGYFAQHQLESLQQGDAIAAPDPYCR